MKEMMETITTMKEDEAKDLLWSIYLQLQTGNSDANFSLEDFDNLLQHFRVKPDVLDSEWEAVHLVVGDSAAGSLRMGMPKNHLVIGLRDTMSIGPLANLSELKGLETRAEWLRDRILDEEDYYHHEYLENMQTFMRKIQNLPEQLPVYIWVAEHASEQVGLRFFVSLMQTKKNPIYLLASTEMYRNLFDSEERFTDRVHTGEMSSKQLAGIFSNRKQEPLSESEKAPLVQEWTDYGSSENTIRLWEDGKLHFYEEEYFDDYILEVIKKLNKKNEFSKSARIVGEVYGNKAHEVGDAFIEYRLRHLALNGKVEIKGVPRGMRYYSVKIKNS